jgi:hypothetical protein
VALLHESKPSATTTTSTSTTANAATTGWTLTSPYWSLESSDLMTVVYRPAWQTMPEYTTAQGASVCGSGRGSRGAACLLACCRRCCHKRGSGSNGSSMSNDDDVFSETFTVHDVVKMETQQHDQGDQEQPPIIIPGVGPCRSVRLHLRPLHGTERLRVPSYWQPAWERHVQRMSQIKLPKAKNNNRHRHRRLLKVITAMTTTSQRKVPS